MGTLNRGGAETLVLDICRNAEHAGLNFILLHRKGGALVEDFRTSGIEMIELRPHSIFDLSYLIRLRTLVKQKKIDILHAHQVIDAVFALVATVGLKSKTVLSLHGHGMADGFIISTVRRLALGYVNKVLFVSENQKQFYQRRFGTIRNSVVHYNGLDFNRLQTSSSHSLRTENGIHEKKIVLGSVGNFSSGRDQLTICRFLALLKLENIPFHFIFVGAASKAEPYLYEQCVEYCQLHGLTHNVSFLGSRSDVPTLLPQLDAFIYSTAHDTFGIAVVEAIAAGIPVFVNDWEVMREITNGGAWATMYQSRNEQDLLQKFLDFYHNREKYAAEAAENALAVRQRYSIETHLTNLKIIYTELLAPAQS